MFRLSETTAQLIKKGQKKEGGLLRPFTVTITRGSRVDLKPLVVRPRGFLCPAVTNPGRRTTMSQVRVIPPDDDSRICKECLKLEAATFPKKA